MTSFLTGNPPQINVNPATRRASSPRRPPGAYVNNELLFKIYVDIAGELTTLTDEEIAGAVWEEYHEIVINRRLNREEYRGDLNINEIFVQANEWYYDLHDERSDREEREIRAEREAEMEHNMDEEEF
jgi:hypothetical protein